MADIVELLSRRLNFTYQLIPPPPAETILGLKQDNGTWNGLMGLMEQGVSIVITTIPSYFNVHLIVNG